MTRLNHAAQQIASVWRMARGAPDWRRELDTSVDGVFRSLTAIVFAVPLRAALYLLFWRMASDFSGPMVTPLVKLGPGFFVTIQTIAYVVEWIVSIVAIGLIARNLKAGHLAAPAIVAFNWAQVMLAGAQLLPLLVQGATGDDATTGLVALLVLAFQIYLMWGIMRRSFERDLATTALILGLLFGVVLLVAGLRDQAAIVILGLRAVA